MFRQTQPAEAPINLAPARRLIALLDPRAALARAYATNRALALLGVLMLLALAVALAGLVVVAGFFGSLTLINALLDDAERSTIASEGSR